MTLVFLVIYKGEKSFQTGHANQENQLASIEVLD